MVRKIKIVKKNPAPSAKPLGVNPSDPWSAKHGITEASEAELLARYLDAKGINPEFVSKETKIAHSKSADYLKWRRDHEFEEQHVISPTFKRHKALEKRSKTLGYIPTSMHEEENLDEGLYVDHEEIAKHLVQKKGKNVNADDIRHASTSHPDAHKVSTDLVRRHVLHLLGKGPDPRNVPQHKEEIQLEAKKPKLSALDRFRQAAAERAKKHDEIQKQQSKDGSGMSSAINRLQKHLNKEENELNEMDQKFIDSLNKLAQTHKVKDSNQKDKVTKPNVKEDAYQDPQAATQTAFDMGTNTNDTSFGDRKREMSKSARMIKALYKKHRMVKEDMYDHEKEDKSVQTYGKKPKVQKTDDESSLGENKPDAAAIMSGGTTLTGEKRDDVEIDPMMKQRPGQNQFNKEFGKKGS